MIEHVFGYQFASVDDDALVATIADCARAEADLAAKRLAASAELTARYTEPDGQREYFAVDGWRLAVAEIAAAMRINENAASREMCIAMALRGRLPRVAALFAAGQLNPGLVATLTWRTRLIVDPRILAEIDSDIAERVTDWGALSVSKLEKKIDALVDELDPDARVRTRTAVRNQDVRFGKPDDEAGTTWVTALMLTTDAELLKRRVTEMSGRVCEGDPRTAGQRRTAALGALAAHADGLTCQCGRQDCPAAGVDSRASSIVINVIAQQDSQTAEPKKSPTMAFLLDGSVIPTPLLAELMRNGAKVQRVQKPDATPDTGYRPTAKTARFVRMRDMTCRFPGCDRPAEFCDIDHTTPYPAGATHASNNKCLCREHHLLKTFGGWRDEQLPDGTVIWTSPLGRTYCTRPTSRLFYPDWDTTTAPLPPATRSDVCENNGLKMPRRRRTRDQDRLARIRRERELNARDRAARPPP